MTMRAFVCQSLSADLSGAALQEVARPAPGPGTVLVRIKAAGVNFPDILMCQGLYQAKPPLPFTPGMEFSGVVAALGEGVTDWAIGDEVVGGGLGAYADYCVAPAQSLRRRPRALSMAEAASFQAAYLTAYVALHRRARIAAGETLLVHGAAGGVGLATVDLGRRAGARVIATASTEDKRAFLTQYGADAALPSHGFRDAVKALTGGRGADVVFDPVGGDVFDESVRAIAFDGRLLVIGFTSGRIPSIAANMALIKGFSVMGVRAGEYGRQFPERGRENLAAIWTMAEQGLIRPHVCAQLPLSQARAAMAMLETRAAIGRVVIRPDLDENAPDAE